MVFEFEDNSNFIIVSQNMGNYERRDWRKTLISGSKIQKRLEKENKGGKFKLENCQKNLTLKNLGFYSEKNLKQ